LPESFQWICGGTVALIAQVKSDFSNPNVGFFRESDVIYGYIIYAKVPGISSMIYSGLFSRHKQRCRIFIVQPE
jgi:hypothetical protein